MSTNLTPADGWLIAATAYQRHTPRRLPTGLGAGTSRALTSLARRDGVQEDDGRMADDVMAVDERLAKLEVTVAKGFEELGNRIGSLDSRITGLERRMEGLEGRIARLEDRMARLEDRMTRLEDRMDAFNEKLDVAVESLEGKMNLLLERMDLQIAEMRAWTTAVTREARADRRLMFSMLKDHRVRIEALEAAARRHPDPAPGV